MAGGLDCCYLASQRFFTFQEVKYAQVFQRSHRFLPVGKPEYFLVFGSVESGPIGVVGGVSRIGKSRNGISAPRA